VAEANYSIKAQIEANTRKFKSAMSKPFTASFAALTAFITPDESPSNLVSLIDSCVFLKL
jgi:hypothetical protein